VIDARFLKTSMRGFWLAAIVVVTVGSLIPSTSLPMRALDQLNINDKLQHLVAYMVLAFLPAIHERRKFVVAAALGAVALGVALEFGQLLSGWRDFEIADMIADAFGVCIGLTTGILIRLNGRVRSLFAAEAIWPGQTIRKSPVFVAVERDQDRGTARKAHQ
jgi:VanZ family protein